MTSQAEKIKKAALLMDSDAFKSFLYKDQGAYKPAPHWKTLKREEKHKIAQFYASGSEELLDDEIGRSIFQYGSLKRANKVERDYESFIRYVSDLNQHIKDVEPALVALEKQRLTSIDPKDENSEPAKKIKAIINKLGVSIQLDKKMHNPYKFDTAIENYIEVPSKKFIPEKLMELVNEQAKEELSGHTDWKKSTKLNPNDITPPLQTPPAATKASTGKKISATIV